MLYFAASTLAGSGIQVTGSHNPKDYNGFKMVLAGRAIYGEEIQALRRVIEGQDWVLPKQAGTIRQVDVGAAYRERIVSGIKLERPMPRLMEGSTETTECQVRLGMNSASPASTRAW